MNEIATLQQAMTIAQYAQTASLVDIRKHQTMFPRITEYKADVLLREVKGILMMVYQYRGQSPSSAEEVETMARSLTAELLADEFGQGLRNLTIEEIRRALRKAALGCGAEMYGINVRSLYEAVVHYVHTDIKDAISHIRAEMTRKDRDDNAQISDIVKAYQSMMLDANRERMP